MPGFQKMTVRSDEQLNERGVTSRVISKKLLGNSHEWQKVMRLKKKTFLKAIILKKQIESL